MTIMLVRLSSVELNKCFENGSKGLQINENCYIIDTDNNEINSVEKTMIKYRNRPSVLVITVGLTEIERELNLINPRQATTSNSIPPKLLKSTKISALRQ